jgi:hypothetical protein
MPDQDLSKVPVPLRSGGIGSFPQRAYTPPQLSRQVTQNVHEIFSASPLHEPKIGSAMPLFPEI